MKFGKKCIIATFLKIHEFSLKSIKCLEEDLENSLLQTVKVKGFKISVNLC